VFGWSQKMGLEIVVTASFQQYDYLFLFNNKKLLTHIEAHQSKYSRAAQ